MKILNTLLTALLFSSVSINAQASQNLDYQAGSQYTAVLNRQNSQWYMVPRIKQDFTLNQANHCRTNASVPPGLWLLTHDVDGKPELLAPSYTPLPAGHSGHIAIIACTDKQGDGLAIPAKLIDWMTNNTGAIYVE